MCSVQSCHGFSSSLACVVMGGSNCGHFVDCYYCSGESAGHTRQPSSNVMLLSSMLSLGYTNASSLALSVGGDFLFASGSSLADTV